MIIKRTVVKEPQYRVYHKGIDVDGEILTTECGLEVGDDWTIGYTGYGECSWGDDV